MNNLLNIYSSGPEKCLFQESPCLLLFQEDSALFKGQFFFSDFPGQKRDIWMLFNLDQQNHIYSISRDSVGPYVIVGKKFSENSAKFYQKYFDDYEIYYECFYFSKDSIEGSWTTTNAKGHFQLKRDPSYSFKQVVQESFGDLMILLRHPSTNEALANALKLLEGSTLKEVEEFRPFLSNSILSVMINGAQEGMPKKKMEKEFEDVEKLFEQYKNINLLSDIEDDDEEQQKDRDQELEDSFEDLDLKNFNSDTTESHALSDSSNFLFNKLTIFMLWYN
jgi:hypothetical protein